MNRAPLAVIALVLAVPAAAWIADSAFQPPRAQSFVTGGSGGGATVTYPNDTVLVGTGPTITLTRPIAPHPTTYSGTYTLAGTATGNTSVTWYASPSGDTGTCTGTTTWSCAVAVTAIDATEAVSRVFLTAIASTGSAIVDIDIGFYVEDAYDVFDADNIDETHNSSYVALDAITTWHNLGTGNSSHDLAQASGGAKPWFRSNNGGTVYFDGLRHMSASTAAHWNYLHTGVDYTLEILFTTEQVSSLALVIVTNPGGDGACAYTGVAGGICVLLPIDSSTRDLIVIGNGNVGASSGQIAATGSGSTAIYPVSVHQLRYIMDDNGIGGGDDITTYVDGVYKDGGDRAYAFSPADTGAIRVGANMSGAIGYKGEIRAIRTYLTALTSTERDINLAVDAWRTGNEAQW